MLVSVAHTYTYVVVVQSCLTLYDLWTVACQASLSLTISWSLPKFMLIASVMPSSHLSLWSPLFLLPSVSPSIRNFSHESSASDDQNTGASASAPVLPMNIQGWCPLRLAGLISLLSKGLLGIFFSTQFKSINSLAFCLLYCPALTATRGHWEDCSPDHTDLCWQDNVSDFQHTVQFFITFLPRSNRLLISWLQSPSTVILEPKKRKSVTTSTFPPSICHAVMGLDAMILVFFNT